MGAPDHRVHQRRGNIHGPGRHVVVDHANHLDDDLAAVSVGGLGNGQGVDGGALVFKGDVPLLVGITGLEQRHVHFGDLIEQSLLSIFLRQRHQIQLGALVELVLADPGIYKQVQSDLGKQGAGSSGRGPDHMGHDAAGEVISLNPVFHNGCTGAAQAAEEAQDTAVHRPLVDIPLHVAVVLPLGKAEGAVDRKVLRVSRLPETPGDRLVQLHGRGAGRKGVDPYGIPVLDQLDRLIHAHQFIHDSITSLSIP